MSAKTERICPICGRPEHVDAAKRALDALDDEQREAIRMMIEGAW